MNNNLSNPSWLSAINPTAAALNNFGLMGAAAAAGMDPARVQASLGGLLSSSAFFPGGGGGGGSMPGSNGGNAPSTSNNPNHGSSSSNPGNLLGLGQSSNNNNNNDLSNLLMMGGGNGGVGGGGIPSIAAATMMMNPNSTTLLNGTTNAMSGANAAAGNNLGMVLPVSSLPDMPLPTTMDHSYFTGGGGGGMGLGGVGGGGKFPSPQPLLSGYGAAGNARKTLANNLVVSNSSSASSSSFKMPNGIEPFPEKLHRLLREVEASGRGDIISFVARDAFMIKKPVSPPLTPETQKANISSSFNRMLLSLSANFTFFLGLQDTFFKEIVPLYFRQTRLSSFNISRRYLGHVGMPSLADWM